MNFGSAPLSSGTSHLPARTRNGQSGGYWRVTDWERACECHPRAPNPKLKNVLDKNYARLEVDAGKLRELIDLVATIPFHHETLKAKDILGHVYEYFLGEFASYPRQEGRTVLHTPKSIVTLIVEMLQPFQGRVYDPCCGSGGFFVQSERFVVEHGGRIGQLSIYG